MVKKQKDKKEEKNLAVEQEMSVVAHADDFALAEEYSLLLEDNGIPNVVKSLADDESGFGVAIYVPEAYYDEAHMIIESQQTHNDFYDFFFDDPDELDSEDFNIE